MCIAAPGYGYCILFMPYLGAGSDINPALAIEGNVVNKFVCCLPGQDDSWYDMVTEQFFTSVKLLKHLKEKMYLQQAQFRTNRTEKALCQISKKWKKSQRELTKSY